jgi:dTDP-glucose 4,6-dehydratase
MRANDGRVLPNFINQSLHNKPLTIYGKGSQTRSFCYVSDLVEGIYRIMQSKQPGPINLGNPNEMKIIDVAKLVIKLTHSKSKIIFVPLPKDDPTRRRPDITKAKKLLKWKPKILFRKGLQKTISYFSKVA